MNKAKRVIESMDEKVASKICEEIGTIDDNATPL